MATPETTLLAALISAAARAWRESRLTWRSPKRPNRGPAGFLLCAWPNILGRHLVEPRNEAIRAHSGRTEPPYTRKRQHGGPQRASRTPRKPAFFFWALRQETRLEASRAYASVSRPVASSQGRQDAAEARDRQNEKVARSPARVSCRHCPGLRYRCVRNGDVVPTWRSRRRCSRLGELRQGLGHGHCQTAEAQGCAGS